MRRLWIMDRVLDVTGYERRASIIEQLHEVALSLDTMWWETLADGSAGATVSLTEASQAVHRALIALGSEEPQGGPP
jgi:hypothetical protein